MCTIVFINVIKVKLLYRRYYDTDGQMDRQQAYPVIHTIVIWPRIVLHSFNIENPFFLDYSNSGGLEYQCYAFRGATSAEIGR